jgi:predicted HTH transcriptional regulator
VPTAAELQPLVTDPREDIGVEYKDWLDATSNHGRATIARAAIALANHGGGFIVIGFAEQGEALVSRPKPDNLAAITQDGANAVVRRYADPEFHVEVYRIAHPSTGVEHVVVSVPGGQTVPVMSRRDCEGVIAQNRCYIRKSGPRSEEPQTREEWRALLNRCVRAQREDMLDAIRAIVTGRVEVAAAAASAEDEFAAFVTAVWVIGSTCPRVATGVRSSHR